MTSRGSDVQFGLRTGESFVPLGLAPGDEDRMDTLLTSTDGAAIAWAREL